jgi:Uma2 family endonuclease
VPADRRDGISDRGIEVPPGLIVEIQSPTSSSIDRVKKPRRYGDFGVPEYWVLDPVGREALIWRFAEGAREPERHAGSFSWHPSGAGESLVLDPGELFRPL